MSQIQTHTTATHNVCTHRHTQTHTDTHRHTQRLGYKYICLTHYYFVYHLKHCKWLENFAAIFQQKTAMSTHNGTNMLQWADKIKVIAEKFITSQAWEVCVQLVLRLLYVVRVCLFVGLCVHIYHMHNNYVPYIVATYETFLWSTWRLLWVLV